ncbi:MAG: hypothetical protein Q9184_003136 [Pyrenodesmia sp. 2 TL-2023]
MYWASPSAIQGHQDRHDNQALTYYVGYHVDVPDIWPEIVDRWDNHLKHALTDQSSSRPPSTLKLAISAASYATFGRAQKSQAAFDAGSTQYSKALVKTNLALSDAREACQDEVLLAVMLLSFYENAVMGTKSNSLAQDIESIGARCFAHHEGAMAMLKLRRQRDHRTSRNNELDKLVRRQLMRTWLLRSMRPPSWFLDGSQFGEHGCALALDHCMMEATKLRYQAKGVFSDGTAPAIESQSGRKEGLQSIFAKAQTLDDVLIIWANQRPVDDRYSMHPVHDDERAGTGDRIFGSMVHIYRTAGHAGMWNRYRAIRLIVNDIILRILSLTESSLGSDTESSTQAVILRIRGLADELCASIPYSLGLVEAGRVNGCDIAIIRKVPASLRLLVKASAASFLCWPLNEALMVSGVPGRHQRYIRDRMLDSPKTHFERKIIPSKPAHSSSMATTNPNPLATDDRARLKAHFDVAPTSHPDRWSKLWDAGNFLPWDRGTPNPALVDLLDQRKDLIGDCFIEDAGKRRRKRALVPGCGKGYDVLLLASYGYDAYGLEVSEKAVERCIEEKSITGDKYPVRDEAVGAGESTFLKGDFFADAWSGEFAGGGTFELIYDYTFFCALNPEMRPAWAQRTSQLLSRKPPGHLICLEFPTYKDPSTGGPPFGLTPETYLEHLSHPGKELPYDESGHVKVESSGRSDPEGLERIDHWQPERTHAIGKGTDWISVWRHR